MEKQDLRPSFNNFKKAFCDHIEGFMMLAFSSIFFEENDLSDNNYGLVVTGAHGAIKDFGGFVKIDHGQSFNSLRIGENWFLRFAEIKFFKPIKPVPQTDWRKLTDRKKIKNPLKSGTRKYHLSHEFFDRIVMDFVDAGVTEAYICNLTYQPSTSPFYDPRLLPIIAGLGEERYEKMEIAKYLGPGEARLHVRGGLPAHRQERHRHRSNPADMAESPEQDPREPQRTPRRSGQGPGFSPILQGLRLYDQGADQRLVEYDDP